jgi:hypothetical protein
MSGFARVLRSEWTKFRTVRTWVAGMVAAVLLVVGLGLMSTSGSHASCGAGDVETACPPHPVGPTGEAVSDKFFFVHRPLDGDGAITARVTSFTGVVRLPDAKPQTGRYASKVVPWAKVGVLVKDGVGQGSTYAAVMLTGAHGVRMQHDYVHDVAGPRAGPWLRLVRSGDTLTGHSSADGRTWAPIGSARLPGLPRQARIGLFAASPGDLTVSSGGLGGGSVAVRFAETTGVFDRVALEGGARGGDWAHDDIGVTLTPDGRPHHPGRSARAGDTFSVTGVGDIGPQIDGMSIEDTLGGVTAGLLAVLVVAVLSATTEHRRGLILTSLVAVPSRGRLLLAKALVAGTVAAAAGLVAAAVTVPVGAWMLRGNGNIMLPVGLLTEVRVVAGFAVLAGAVAVLGVAVGTLLRRGVPAVAVVAAAVVVPHLLATSSALPPEVARWALSATPAAGFAVLQSVPAYEQVTADFSPQGGFYPLPPLAGLAVTAVYAVLALAAAVVRARRRDA